MQLRLTFFVQVLLCMFMCQCYGAPPKPVGPTSHSRTPYTRQEDEFIIKELLLIFDDYLQGKCTNVWDNLAVKFNNEWLAGTSGFPQERTPDSLRCHFKNVLVKNHSETDVRVPEKLKTMFNQAKVARDTKGGSDRKHKYTPEENAFIIEELRDLSCDHLHSSTVWKRIKAKHDKKRHSSVDGFKQERKSDALRSHMCSMWQKNKLPMDVRDKFKEWFKKVSGASTSKPLADNQQADSQETSKELDEQEIEDMVENLRCKDSDFFMDFSKLE